MDTQPSLRDRIGQLLRENRVIILLEVLLLTAFALFSGQNKVFYFLLIGWLSLWLRRVGWRGIGLRAPSDWQRTILLGVLIGAAYQVFSILLLVPFLHRVTGTALDLSEFASLPGSIPNLIFWLAISWIFAATLEELAYRGYVFSRITDLLGNSRWGLGVGIFLSAACFGLAHLYQGVSGVLETFVFGAVLSGLYLYSGRNLWLPIIAHGVNNTFGFLLIFFGFLPIT